MFISDFDFDLPDDLIAQEPLSERDDSRMLVVQRGSATLIDEQFTAFPHYLEKSDVVVLNNTKVFPARLIGASETGATIELFLIEELEENTWITLARPARRLSPGKKIIFGEALTMEVLEKTSAGKVIVRYKTEGKFDDIVQKIGRTPLPPYIKRDHAEIDADRDRYQTIYASNRGAIAAPTAGLHFTPKIFDAIKNVGATIAEITLHVGYGTFEPVRVNKLSEHAVSSERYEIDQQNAEILSKAKSDKNRIIAIGTTTTRALESSMAKYGRFAAGHDRADLTITPGHKFRAVNALLTNFHLPQSSLLVLVSTFGGHELIMNAYRHAVAFNYRFYSYGDCMLIV